MLYTQLPGKLGNSLSTSLLHVVQLYSEIFLLSVKIIKYFNHLAEYLLFSCMPRSGSLDDAAPLERNLRNSLQQGGGIGQEVTLRYLLHQTSPKGRDTWPGILELLLWQFLVAYSTCHLIYNVCFQKLLHLAWVQNWKAEASMKLTSCCIKMLLHVKSHNV